MQCLLARFTVLALFFLASSIACAGEESPEAPAAPSPNVVLVLADDMGIGDVSGLNPEGKIPTPKHRYHDPGRRYLHQRP